MRHARGYRRLNRTHEHRKALFANMAGSLIEHEQIGFSHDGLRDADALQHPFGESAHGFFIASLEIHQVEEVIDDVLAFTPGDFAEFGEHAECLARGQEGVVERDFREEANALSCGDGACGQTEDAG